MGKKKKSFKVSHTRKLRDKSREFFAKYENNVTRRAFINNYDKFIVFCRTFYDCKTKDECKNHIDDYVDYLKQKGLSPSLSKRKSFLLLKSAKSFWFQNAKYLIHSEQSEKRTENNPFRL